MTEVVCIIYGTDIIIYCIYRCNHGGKSHNVATDVGIFYNEIR